MIDGESLLDVVTAWHAGQTTNWHNENKALDPYRDSTGNIADQYAQDPRVVDEANRLRGKKEVLDSFSAALGALAGVHSLEITPTAE